MRNIYYLESAPQIISSFESAANFPGENFFFIRLNGKSKNDQQIRNVISTLELATKGTVVLGKPLSIFASPKLIRLFFSVGEKRLLTGDCRGKYSQLLCFLFPTVSKILLDDGVASLTYLYDNQFSFEKVKELDAGQSYRIDLTNHPFEAKFNLFTSLPLTLDGKVESHRFQGIKEIFGEVRLDEGKALFIGSKVVEVGLMTEDDFHLSLEAFIERNSGKNLLYAAHRAESLQKLERYSNFLEVLYYDLPIELEFLKRGVVPSSIGGFYTGAFVFLKYLDLPLTILNSSIRKTEFNQEFHVEIDRYDCFFKLFLDPNCI